MAPKSRLRAPTASPRSPRNQHPASRSAIIARRERGLSGPRRRVSGIQHVSNEAAEEDDDDADGQEKSESCVVDHALPPQIGLDVLTFSASAWRGLAFAYMRGP